MTGRLLLVAAAALAAASAWAAGHTFDAAKMARQGAGSTPACAACHGAAGEGSTTAPRLAGLDARYLARQLDDFASGPRPSQVMGPIARGVGPAGRRSLAAWYAARPVRWSAEPTKSALLARGRRLAEVGDWSVGAPPCAACHGPDGQGVGGATPPLIGQSEAYLYAQLVAFHDGARSGPLGLMSGVAKRLAPQDLRAAAAWYASRPMPLRARRP